MSQIDISRLTQLIIDSRTVVYLQPDLFLELFCSAPLLSTFQIHLIAHSESDLWQPTKRSGPSIITCLSQLSVIIEDVGFPLPYVLATGRFFDWLSDDAGAAIQTVKTCFIEGPSKLGDCIDQFLRRLPFTLVEVGINLTTSFEESWIWIAGKLSEYYIAEEWLCRSQYFPVLEPSTYHNLCFDRWVESFLQILRKSRWTDSIKIVDSYSNSGAVPSCRRWLDTYNPWARGIVVSSGWNFPPSLQGVYWRNSLAVQFRFDEHAR